MCRELQSRACVRAAREESFTAYFSEMQAQVRLCDRCITVTHQLAPSREIDAQAERAAADTFRRSDHLGILHLCAC